MEICIFMFGETLGHHAPCVNSKKGYGWGFLLAFSPKVSRLFPMTQGYCMRRRVNAGPSVAAIGLACMCFLAGCSRKEAPRAVKIAGPDRAQLLAVALKAVAARLPSVRADALEPRQLMYTCYRDRMANRTNELFEVRFRIKDSRREAETDGERVIKVDDIAVRIRPDGGVGADGVSRVTSTYVSPDLSMLSRVGSESVPVPGALLDPGEGAAALAKPVRSQAEDIALRAIAAFLPAVDVRGLQFDRLSFFDITDSENSIRDSCYMVTYWNTISLKVAAAGQRITMDGEQVTVRIGTDGQVRRDGVSIQPLHFVCSRAMLEQWRRNE
mgnify:CR=1 FL=1